MNYREYFSSDSITLMEGAIADTNCIFKATSFSLLFKFKCNLLLVCFFLYILRLKLLFALIGLQEKSIDF